LQSIIPWEYVPSLSITTGGVVGITPPGVLVPYGKALCNPVGRLHFAGAETASEWIGYLDGAIQSGWRAAKAILREMRIDIDDPEDKLDQASL